MIYEIEIAMLKDVLNKLMARYDTEPDTALADAIDHIGTARELLSGDTPWDERDTDPA